MKAQRDEGWDASEKWAGKKFGVLMALDSIRIEDAAKFIKA